MIADGEYYLSARSIQPIANVDIDIGNTVYASQMRLVGFVKKVM